MINSESQLKTLRLNGRISEKNQLHVRTVECLLSWCYVSTESFRTAYCRAPNLRAHQEHTMAVNDGDPLECGIQFYSVIVSFSVI